MSVVAPLPHRRSLLTRAASPLVAPKLFDFWATKFNRTWTWERPVARILAREQASSDAVTLRLQPNRHFAGVLPGQHLNISAELDGARVTRSYSPSAIGSDGAISITVKAIEGGKLSQHLCQVAKVGDVLDLGPAFGEMLLPDAIDKPQLLLAAGSGITPLMAMIREQDRRGMPQPLTLLYWARCREQLCFVDELRALARQHAGFEVRFLLTRQAAQAADEVEGHVSDVVIDGLPLTLQAQQAYACGPGGFVENVRKLLADKVVTFQAEAFTPPPAMVFEQDSGEVQLTLVASGRTLSVPRGKPLLEALEAQGIKPKSGCRMGICNTCACAKSAGSTRHVRTGEIENEPVSALRLCVNSASSDLVLDL